MVIIGIIGRPGSGKSTFMNFIQNSFNIKAVIYPSPCLTNPTYSLNNELAETLTNLLIEAWDDDIVIGPLYSEEIVKRLKLKPYFHLIYLDAEVSLRFDNYNKKNIKNTFDLSSFIRMDEEVNEKFGIGDMRKLAKYEMRNKGNFERFLLEIQKMKGYILRPIKPDWDMYFMNIAFSVRTRSNCMRKNAGAILVRNNRIISTGYTGTPEGLKNCNQGGCLCCNKNIEDLVQCLCIHAEENCILEVGIAGSEGSICYCTEYPCIWCMKILVQGKIKKLVYSREDDDIEEKLAIQVLRDNKIESQRYIKDLNIF